MLAELGLAEQQWMRDNLGALVELGITLDPPSLQALYDEQYAAWAALPEAERYDPAPVITVIGVGLGEYLRHHTGMSWMVENRGDESELALAGSAPDTAVLYPASAIGQRWRAGERGFLVALAAAMIEDVRRSRAQSLS